MYRLFREMVFGGRGANGLWLPFDICGMPAFFGTDYYICTFTRTFALIVPRSERRLVPLAEQAGAYLVEHYGWIEAHEDSQLVWLMPHGTVQSRFEDVDRAALLEQVQEWACNREDISGFVRYLDCAAALQRRNAFKLQVERWPKPFIRVNLVLGRFMRG